MMDIRNGIVYNTASCCLHGTDAVGLSPIEGKEKEFEAMMKECTCTTVEVVVRRVAVIRRLRAASRYAERPRAARGVVVIDQAGQARHFGRFPVMVNGDRILDELWEQGKPCVPTLV